MRKIIITQFVILLAGVSFAWVNFFVELANWLNQTAGTFGCAVGVKNPFLTPCFYGAIFFTIAFGLSAVLLAKSKSPLK
ncbi:MAG: hypothetical protein WCX08_02010 [Candidatus Buchananbacteria bacterium]